MIPIEYFLILGAILFAIGAYGVVTKSNAIVVLMCIELMLNAANINFVAFGALMCIELMLNAANINFVAFGAFNGDVIGQAFVVMTISVAAAEVAVGIAILLNAYKLRKTNDLDDAELTSMRW